MASNIVSYMVMRTGKGNFPWSLIAITKAGTRTVKECTSYEQAKRYADMMNKGLSA